MGSVLVSYKFLARNSVRKAMKFSRANHVGSLYHGRVRLIRLNVLSSSFEPADKRMGAICDLYVRGTRIMGNSLTTERVSALCSPIFCSPVPCPPTFCSSALCASPECISVVWLSLDSFGFVSISAPTPFYLCNSPQKL